MNGIIEQRRGDGNIILYLIPAGIPVSIKNQISIETGVLMKSYLSHPSHLPMAAILCFNLILPITAAELPDKDLPPGWLFKNYHRLQPFADARGKIGLKDSRGRVIITPRFDQMGPFLNRGDRAYRIIPFHRACRRNDFPCVSMRGQLLEFPLYPDFPVAPVILEGECRLLYIKADDSLHIQGAFPEGLIPCSSGKDSMKFGYRDISGKWAIPPRYDGAFQFSEGLALVLMDETISRSSLRYSCEYRKGRKYGFIDNRGEMIIPLNEYTSPPSPFKEGRSRVEVELSKPLESGGQQRHYYGYMDKKGKMVIKPRFEMSESFHRGIARVMYRDYTLYNCLEPLNNCLGGCALILSGRLGGSRAFKAEKPSIFCVISRSGRILYSTKGGWDGVDTYIKKNYPGWFNEPREE